MKPMAPGSIFHHIYLLSTSYFCRRLFCNLYHKNPKIPCCNLFTFLLFYILVIFYIYLYQISSLQVTVMGLTTPLSRWVQVFDCLCRCIDWRLACTSYWIDTLVLKPRELLISTLLHHPFLFKEKPTQAQEVAELSLRTTLMLNHCLSLGSCFFSWWIFNSNHSEMS